MLIRSAYRALVVLLMVGSTALVAFRMNEPLWEHGHQGYIMAEYPQNALNYLRFGYVETKFGLVMNYGSGRPAEFSYRTDHPILSAVLISMMYQLLGVSDWTSRLAFVVINILGTVATGYLALLLFRSHRAALVALAFSALSPEHLYYARMPESHTIAVSSAMFVFLAYWLWFKTSQRRYLIALYAAFAIAANMDWIAYFSMPAIVIHYAAFARDKPRWWFAASLAAFSLLLVGAFILSIVWLKGSAAYGDLWGTFVFRAFNIREGNTITFTWRELLSVFGTRAERWLTVPVMLLSAAWIVWFVSRAIRRRATPAEGLIACLWVFACGYNVAFPNLVYVHDFSMIDQFAPVCAITAAALLDRLWAHPRTTTLASAVAAAAVATFLIQSADVLQQEHRRAPQHVGSYYVGRALREAVSPTGRYIDAAALDGDHAGLRAYVVADRSHEVLRSVDEITSAISETDEYEAVVVSNSSDTNAALATYLIEGFARDDVFGRSIFHLAVPRSNVLMDSQAIEHPARIPLGLSMEFLGFDWSDNVHETEGRLGWWTRYLNAHARLLPQYRRTLRVATYWRKESENSSDYMLVTKLASEPDGRVVLEPTTPGLDRLYPTSRWPVARIVRSAFEVEVPPDAPLGRYAVQAGVSASSGTLTASGGGDRRLARVGEIDIRPRARQ